MTALAATELNGALALALHGLDLGDLRRRFERDGGFIALPEFLPPDALAPLLDALPRLRGEVHRNYLPRHKKGGSVSRHVLDRLAPDYAQLYRADALRRFFRKLSGGDLQLCPEDDPHAYALYYYTQAGDHIGWHYDTSYYKGRRYTALIGLVDRSDCRLEYRLHTKTPGRAVEEGALALAPGMLVFFDGDALQHRITPLASGERIALTFEYLTHTGMDPWWRLLSNLKDAFAYFGLRQVFGRRKAG